MSAEGSLSTREEVQGDVKKIILHSAV